ALATLPIADRDGLEQQLVSRLKALFELVGAWLDPSQQAYTLDLYISRPTLKYACSGWSAPPVDPACDAGALNAYMDMCYRMSVVDVAPQTAAARLNQCLNQAATIAALSPDSCQADAYRAAYEQLLIDLLKKTAANLTAVSGRLQQDKLQDQLARINGWYNAERQFYPTQDASNPNERLWTLLGQILRAFWTEAYAKVGISSRDINPLDTASVTDTMLNDLFTRGMEADRSVLLAAFSALPTTSDLPLRGAPLLYILPDGLKVFYARLSDVTMFHDMGCRFAAVPCERSGIQTEVSELFRLLAFLPDAARFSTQVTASTHVRSGWRDVFGAMNQ